MDLELAGKLCLVSGASRGLGRAIAHALAREGARIAAIARGQAGLDALLGELPGHGHAAIAADVATADGATAAVDGCVQALGGIDVVVTNVGKSFARDAAAMDDADLAGSLDLNLWSAARVAQRAVPHLVARGGGSITMIASIWGREAGGAPAYNAAKAAVIALGKAMARDYAKHAIRGRIQCLDRTQMSGQFFSQKLVNFRAQRRSLHKWRFFGIRQILRRDCDIRQDAWDDREHYEPDAISYATACKKFIHSRHSPIPSLSRRQALNRRILLRA